MKKNRIEEILVSFMDETINSFDLPGLAVGISLNQGDSILELRQVRGFKNYEARNDVSVLSDNNMLSVDDIFHCASLSKLLVCESILNLIELGLQDSEGRRITLDSRLSDIMPDLKITDKRYEQIRLWNMLSHTSGLSDFDDYHWDDPKYDTNALHDFVYSDEVRLKSLLWAPQDSPEYIGCSAASRFRYSNMAYEINGHLLSIFADSVFPGQNYDFEKCIEHFIFNTAGMKESTMKTFTRDGWASDSKLIKGNFALPHAKAADNSIKVLEHYPYNREHAPSSTFTSTISDLLKLGRFFLHIPHENSWKVYTTVPNNGEKMGLAWFMRNQNGHTLYGHEGSDDGFRTSFWICPDMELVLVVMSNLSNAPVKKINKRLFDVFESYLRAIKMAASIVQ